MGMAKEVGSVAFQKAARITGPNHAATNKDFSGQTTWAFAAYRHCARDYFSPEEKELYLSCFRMQRGNSATYVDCRNAAQQ